MPRIALSIRVLVCLAGAGMLAVVPQARQTQAAQQTPPTFRGRTVLVPIDVRVLDKDGKPITGLTQADFKVFEDNVPQQIGQFSTVTLTPEPDRESRPLVRATPSATPEPQNRRVFLLLLGRGKLDVVSKGIEALLRFARQRVMPQDQLAVFAYNRGTDFTTNHEYIAAVLERFRGRHEYIEGQMRFNAEQSAMYGVTSLPKPLQVDIDQIFNAPGGPALRTPNAAAIVGSDRMTQYDRELRDARISAELAQAQQALFASGGVTAPNPSVTSSEQQRLLSFGFSEFVTYFPQSFQDLASLYQGIEYLRNVEGEKHLVFVTEDGLFLPSLEDHTSIAAMASDARVAIDIIQTGGLPRPAPGTVGRSFTASFVARSLHEVSELTGGQASVYDYASNAINRLIAANQSSYLLGYSPTNTTWDGKFRKIKVEVNRKDAKVLYRHGYFGREEQALLPFDRRESVTYRRIAMATNLPGDIGDIRVSFSTSDTPDKTGKGVTIKAKINPERLTWKRSGNDLVAEIDVAIYCGDLDKDIVGEHLNHANLRIPADALERAKQTGLSYEVRIPIKDDAMIVKMIVYDYASDLVGTSSWKRLR